MSSNHHELVRRVAFQPYRADHGPTFLLELYDVGKSNADGKHAVGYRLLQQDKADKVAEVLFDSIAGVNDSHVYTRAAIDGDDAVRAVMGFLTLRPGDTDRDYFANCTDKQLAYCVHHAESLAAEVNARFPERADLEGRLADDAEPRVYIASLMDYNEGRLVGRWYTLTNYTDADELFTEVNDWLADLNARDGRHREEVAIHDYEYMADLGEHPDREELSDYIRALNAGVDVNVLKAYVGYGHPARDCHEAYCGSFDTQAEFAEQFANDVGLLDKMPEELRSYFDYDRYARDLLIDSHFEVDGYYFRRT